ncbi:unnamed protein product, partial [Brenthis ino]
MDELINLESCNRYLYVKIQARHDDDVDLTDRATESTAANLTETAYRRYYSAQVYAQTQVHSLFLLLSNFVWDDDSTRLVRSNQKHYVLSEARG